MRRIGELIDRTWPWLPIALAALAVSVGLLSYATGSGKTDAQRVAELVQDFGNAAANRDGEGMCELLTESFREQVEQRIAGQSCPEHTRSFGIGTGGRELRDTPKAEPQVRGDRAAVLMAGIGRRADVRRVGGQWRLDALTPVSAQSPSPFGP